MFNYEHIRKFWRHLKTYTELSCIVILCNCCFTDSIIQETCRLSSGVFVVRYIIDDTTFTTSDGKSFLLRKGDRVALYPPATHKDPEVFENPLVSELGLLVTVSN